ncbi:hypothetical protein SLOPH_496 [Spraguea lophii 42_110]|uniref:Protein kinase domain-containing protein n=1 Tax=Spraguea lophii (strain 42_110) TaxID=1358809 RepID=S7W663_SPRLO|nr:hypothetical protein SLOPH_496 [Spraguea lophii 42_110]
MNIIILSFIRNLNASEEKQHSGGAISKENNNGNTYYVRNYLDRKVLEPVDTKETDSINLIKDLQRLELESSEDELGTDDDEETLGATGGVESLTEEFAYTKRDPICGKLKVVKKLNEFQAFCEQESNISSEEIIFPPYDTAIYEENIMENVEEAKKLLEKDDKQFMEKKFKKIAFLGSGTYGNVFLFKTRDKGVSVAIKHTTFENPLFIGTKEHEVTEKLSKMSHKNIIQFYDQIIVNESMLIFMELCPGESLHHFISNKKNEMSDFSKREIIGQAFEGISFLHDNEIVHGDISTGNILVNKKGKVKIIDFGFSRLLKLGTYIRGAPQLCWFTSPEILHGIYSHSSDIWAMAICMYAVYEREYPFNTTVIEENVLKRKRFICIYTENTPIIARNLIDKMLHPKLSQRLGPNKGDIYLLRQDPYFSATSFATG